MTVEVTRKEDARVAGGREKRAVRSAEELPPRSRACAPAAERPGFLRRYRLPLFLGVVALCLYAGSILYILYGRGQIA